ncbi:MAG TPA: hypothetical protein DHW02_19540 [Ktedonobacter sp.]|nr:hypothetical protein [Ktedonobacter sp.]
MAHSRFIRFRFLLMLASLLVFVSVGIMLPATSFAKSVTHLQSTVPAARSWSFVASPNQGSNYDGLSSVAAVSASDVWAVGDFVTSSGFAQTLIEQWNGSSWSIVASPNQSSYDNELYSVTAVSATDIWAVGAFQSSEFSLDQTLIEHWDGTSWSIVASPNQGSGINGLSAVAAVSATNIWAVGYASSQTLIEHWDGTSWSIVASPNPGTSYNRLYGVAAIPTSSNLWAVGAYSSLSIDQPSTLIEYYG